MIRRVGWREPGKHPLNYLIYWHCSNKQTDSQLFGRDESAISPTYYHVPSTYPLGDIVTSGGGGTATLYVSGVGGLVCVCYKSIDLLEKFRSLRFAQWMKRIQWNKKQGVGGYSF